MSPLASQPSVPRLDADEGSLEEGVLQTVAYADIFDFPLTLAELHRGLIGVRASPSAVRAAVEALVPDRLRRRGDHVFLPGRDAVVETRLRRNRRAAALWPRARTYAHRIASLPFVRMVAVTGSLARDSVEEGADVDLLIVTEPGRLWVCRALVGLFTRWAERRGTVLCANYFLSETALELDERNVYTAHELLQMVPMAGPGTYRRIRIRNGWVHRYFPNAGESAVGPGLPEPDGGPIRRMAERLLRTRLGSWLEVLERRRKVRKSDREGRDLTEARFDADCFKGHFDGHGGRTLEAYRARLASLDEEGGA